MKVREDFFDKLREEVRNAASGQMPKSHGLSIYNVLKSINGCGDANFDACLKQIDWFSIDSLEIIPREKVRAFAKSILDNDKRYQTLKFLQKYEDYYFHDVVIPSISYEDFKHGVEDFKHPQMVYSISDFHKELCVLIEQIESTGEFSTGKFDKLNADIIALKNHIKKLEDEKMRMSGMIEELKMKISNAENKPQPRHNALPDLDAICKYAQTLSRDEVKTIQNMLFSLMDITDINVKNKIASIKPDPTPTNIAMGDIVTNKYVK